MKLVRADAVYLQARLTLAAMHAGHAAPRGRDQVDRAVAALDGEGVGYASVFAALLRAGAASLAGPAEADETTRWLQRAIELATTHDMAIQVAAAQALLGALRPGAAGAAARAAAAAYVGQHRIADPDRFFAIVASVAPPAAPAR